MRKFDIVGLKELRSVKEMASLNEKCALVTGAAGGIGRSSAAALAEMGANVALTDLPGRLDTAQENARYIAGKFGVKAIAVAADLTKESDVNALIDQVTKQLGGLHIVHSNAGGGVYDDHGDMSFEDWNKVINICLNTMFLVNQKSAQWMRSNGVHGSIINTASMSGHIINRAAKGERTMIAYNAAKAAIINLTKGMAADFREYGIRFNSISPGYMLSGLDGPEYLEKVYDQWVGDVPMGRCGTMNDVGGIVTFLASDLSAYMTGSDLIMDGGYTIW